jgi:hypothetical protein
MSARNCASRFALFSITYSKPGSKTLDSPVALSQDMEPRSPDQRMLALPSGTVTQTILFFASPEAKSKRLIFQNQEVNRYMLLHQNLGFCVTRSKDERFRKPPLRMTQTVLFLRLPPRMSALEALESGGYTWHALLAHKTFDFASPGPPATGSRQAELGAGGSSDADQFTANVNGDDDAPPGLITRIVYVPGCRVNSSTKPFGVMF